MMACRFSGQRVDEAADMGPILVHQLRRTPDRQGFLTARVDDSHPPLIARSAAATRSAAFRAAP